jgi:hypothetical protein
VVTPRRRQEKARHDANGASGEGEDCRESHGTLQSVASREKEADKRHGENKCDGSPVEQLVNLTVRHVVVSRHLEMVACGAVRCGAVRCGAVRCGAVRCVRAVVVREL